MNNLMSYCGLVDARISASEKDLPVPEPNRLVSFHNCCVESIILHYPTETNLCQIQRKVF